MEIVELNKPVPSFIAQATNLKDVALSALRGWNVVLFFYAKDSTPGCTTEGLDFREAYAEFKKNRTVIFGVSKDTLKSHEHFKSELALPFELICDSEGKLCRLFDVIRPQNLLGKQIMGVDRSTFLIDRKGILRQEWRKVRVTGHVEEVLEAVEELNAEGETTSV